MSGVNKVIILGRVGKDPEVKFSKGGVAMCDLSLATSEKRKNKETGESEETTSWHMVKCFGKVAELAGEYVSKGREVFIEGKLNYYNYEKDGRKVYVTEIIADNMTFVGSKNDGPARDTDGARRNEPAGEDFGGNKPSGGGGGRERDGERNGRTSGAPTEDEIPFAFPVFSSEIVPS